MISVSSYLVNRNGFNRIVGGEEARANEFPWMVKTGPPRLLFGRFRLELINRHNKSWLCNKKKASRRFTIMFRGGLIFCVEF